MSMKVPTMIGIQGCLWAFVGTKYWVLFDNHIWSSSVIILLWLEKSGILYPGSLLQLGNRQAFWRTFIGTPGRKTRSEDAKSREEVRESRSAGREAGRIKRRRNDGETIGEWQGRKISGDKKRLDVFKWKLWWHTHKTHTLELLSLWGFS